MLQHEYSEWAMLYLREWTYLIFVGYWTQAFDLFPVICFVDCILEGVWGQWIFITPQSWKEH